VGCSAQIAAELQASSRTFRSQHAQSSDICNIVEPAACFCCAASCRFADCMHLAEPGCAVTAAELERHEHYIKFLAEVKVCCICICIRDGVAWLVWQGKVWLCGQTCFWSCLSAVHETCGLAGPQGRFECMQSIISYANVNQAHSAS
jgi:hypothetical protein